jgi:hypothetical protein
VAVLPVLALCMCSSEEAVSPSAERPPCPEVSLTRTGSQHTAVDETNDGGTWDLRGAVWDENAPDPIEYPVRSEEWTKSCVVGGTILGGIPRRWTRDQWYDGEDGGTPLGSDAFRLTMTDTRGNFVVIKDAHVEDFEDAYDPNSPEATYTTYLVHVRARFVRDDCVENEDVPHNLVIRDSLFDGCFTAFAERPHGSSSARNGTGAHSFTVDSSLVHVRPQRLGPGYCGAEEVDEGRCRPTRTPEVWVGAYGIWKWSDEAAREVAVRDSIFRLDMPSYSSCSSQEWPNGTYENVTLVWTGAGRYANAGGCHNRLPKGVRLTTDVGAWRTAKKAWLCD